MPKVFVTDCLERAREAAALADEKPDPEKKRLMELADMWLNLAKEAANDAAHAKRRLPPELGPL